MTTHLERMLTLIYAGFGMAMGFFSRWVGILSLAIAVPILLYLVSFFLLKHFIKYKKTKWLLINSVITYILIWQVMWIFLFNTR